jgi:pentatricopeptide repeat protein
MNCKAVHLEFEKPQRSRLSGENITRPDELFSELSCPSLKEDVLDKIYRQVCENPDDWNLIMALAFKHGYHEEALELCKKMLSAKCNLKKAIRFLARTLEKLTFFGEAEKYFQLGVVQKDIFLHNLYLQFLLKHPRSTSHSLLKEHQEYARLHCQKFAGGRQIDVIPWDGERKINLGFTCSFFGSSTILHQLYCWLKHISQEKFNIFLYVGDEVFPDYLVNASEKSRHTPVSKVSDRDFISITRNDELDILVELNGFSPGHRFLAMYNRCAPIQVSYLNHTATCGLENIDYLLTDTISVPKDDEENYTETICRIPECFFCFNFDDEMDFPVSEFLPFVQNGFITYGFFGDSSKLNNRFLEIVAKILKETNSSRFMIANLGMSAKPTREKLKEFFSGYGVNEDRLLLLPGTDRRRIAIYHQQVDISLDSWPYCGGNTIAESLWYGVPVMTLYGARFSSRYGASLLKACGLDDFVAYNEDEYISKSTSLATDLKLLGNLRKNLRKEMKGIGGFSDTKTFAKKMEEQFIWMIHNLEESE